MNSVTFDPSVAVADGKVPAGPGWGTGYRLRVCGFLPKEDLRGIQSAISAAGADELSRAEGLSDDRRQ